MAPYPVKPLLFILLIPVAIAARTLPIWFLCEIALLASFSYLWRIHRYG